MTRYVCLIFFLVCSAPAFADTRLPNTSYALQSEDGDRVLVMLLAHNPSPASINGVVYPRSGLYKVGDPPELVWEFGGYLSSVLLSKDGQYLVRPGLWKPHCQRCSVEFYKNGNKLREYLTHELVKDRSSVSRDRWGRPRWKKASRFYSEKNYYIIETVDENLYVFDIISGEVVGKRVKHLPNHAALLREPLINSC